MLRRISLKNFKAFEQVSIDLGLITVLIGPNGTGKSSIAQALMLLKQSRQKDRLALEGPYVALGDFEELLHHREKAKGRGGTSGEEVSFSMEVELDEAVPPLVRSPGTRYLWELVFDGQGLVRGVKGGLREPGQEPVVTTPDRDLKVEVGGSQCWVVPHSQVQPGLRRIRAAGSEDGLSEAQNVIKTFSAKVDFLSRSFLVPAIRGFDQPQYPLSKAPIDDFLSLGATAQPSEVASTLAYRRDLEDRISSWSERVVGIKIRAKLIPPQNVTVEAIPVASPHVRRNITNEGFGANQLIPLLIQLATAPPGAVIAIEEPEIHLHPGAQSLLAETLVKVALLEKKQMLITTHSEHILMSFLTQVAQPESKLRPEDLSVYYFEKKEGAALATRLSVNEKGQLSGGLRGFFEASLDQLEEYLKALAR